ncbi:MAG: dTDP-4-dehydrorhamnose reductase [Armatimonadota bacterium]|nr:dTDP-4-dehydrorhamnose reductase [Armatimonadota bacterium]MDR7443292.1 dTDP-4-dehydrorhamnose reductase [Armatimonadota bacterium]MDR7569959.1 dTDP-4-dehydrorhamnose reductase [Armatimonadota bacterium]MDR7614378.1 dTDP-4-dehydrorhamnose reductase [Armatimonadota bacterium]
MKRVVVIGATGQLGREVVRALREAGACPIGLGHGEVECADPASVAEAILPLRPEAVVNCAAYVRVDECEDRPDVAFRVNALGALNVARMCREVQARCVYLSTDYVFDGGKADPYGEEDPPNPINVYGASKLAGEYLVRQTCPDALIVRVASLFGGSGARTKGGNFVLSVLERARRGEPLQVVTDVRMSPTYAVDAARALVDLLRRGAGGVFHVVNDGSCTWYDLACQVLVLLGYRATVQPVPQALYPTRARRPANSALSTAKLKALGIRMRPWEEALSEYLAALRTSGIPLPAAPDAEDEEETREGS